MNMPYNNLKTQLCRFYEKDMKCKYGKNCSYAHGDFELRKPYQSIPQESNQPFKKPQEYEMNGDQKNGQYKVQPINNMHQSIKQEIRHPQDNPNENSKMDEVNSNCSKVRIIMNNNDEKCRT